MSKDLNENLDKLVEEVRGSLDRFQSATDYKFTPEIRIDWMCAGDMRDPHKYVPGTVTAEVSMRRGR
ncbi:hypothetical protein [Marinobacter sp. JSM 1782161]|uniref:hypothetical protein n=1 Tax=Marinobacter sp. JSM 1782161 TaxID=2685906 RepID=UPI001403A218|nr:hypothetical protein [Marinobacter sp. JSM 1782161]